MAKKDAKKQTDDQIAKKEKAAKKKAAASKRAGKSRAKKVADRVITRMQPVLSGIGSEKKARIESELRTIIESL